MKISPMTLRMPRTQYMTTSVLMAGQPYFPKPIAKDTLSFSGKTFQQAIKTSDLAEIESHLEQGKDINQPLDAAGNSALHLAAKYEQDDVFQLLLDHGANITAKNQHHEIPLMVAAERGHHHIVNMLLRSSILAPRIQEQVYATNQDGLRADQLAEHNGFESLAKTLEAKMRAVGPPSKSESTSISNSIQNSPAPIQVIKQHYMDRKPFSQYTGEKEPCLTEESAEYLATRIQDDLEDGSEKAKLLTKVRLATQCHKGISDTEKGFWNKVSLKAVGQPILEYLNPVKKGLQLVAGMDNVKQELKTKFITSQLYQTNPESFRRADGTMPYAKPTPLYGLLLEGPPGTGKSYIAEKLAEELGRPPLILKFSDIGSKMYSESEKAITQAFEEAAAHAPSIMIIDEIDSFLLAKGDAKDTDIKLINTMLTELQEARKKGVTVIGTTNHKNKLEEASIRDGRFDAIVHVPPPDQKARLALFNMYLPKYATPDGKLPFSSRVRAEFAAKTRGFAAPKIETLCKELGTVAAERREDISPELMFKLIQSKAPSYKREIMDLYPTID